MSALQSDVVIFLELTKMANSRLASSRELDVFDAAALFVAAGAGEATGAGAGAGAGVGVDASDGVGGAGVSMAGVFGSVSALAEEGGSVFVGVAEVASPAEVSVSSAGKATGVSSGDAVSSIGTTETPFPFETDDRYNNDDLRQFSNRSVAFRLR